MGCSSSSNGGQAGQPGEQDFFDKYILGKKIGRGAFAQVRICTKVSRALRKGDGESDSSGSKERAVKILDLRDPDRQDEVSVQQAKAAHKEATVWKQVGTHPNVVDLYDLFFIHNFCYMVMEKCPSGFLQALEALPELSEATLGNVFGQMLLGIAHCHSVGVVHRDVKPDNFMVGGENGSTVKLCDFGLSAIIPKQGKLPGVFGTAPFMCPEMLIDRSYDEKADVWSFAVIVYVLLFGQFPYMPKTQSCKGMKQAIIDGAVPPSFEPVTRASGVQPGKRSKEAIDLLRPLLNRNADARPTAAEGLEMAYLKEGLSGGRCPSGELPSLRPMVYSAKKVGAFEIRDPCQETHIDVVLNHIQMQRHGQQLPPVEKKSSSRRVSDGDSRSKQKGSKTSSVPSSPGLPADSDRSRSSTTTCDSLSIDGSADRGGAFAHGSGWSKGTFSHDEFSHGEMSHGIPMMSTKLPTR